MALQLLEEANENFSKKFYDRAEAQYTKLIETYHDNCKDASILV